METTRLQAIVRRASKLKSILQVIQGLSNYEASMRVTHEAITITILNQPHTTPFYITLRSNWFIRYDFSFHPGESWTMRFSIRVLCDILLHAEDEHIVAMQGNMCRNGSGDGHLIFTFIEGNRQTHPMVVHGYEPTHLPSMGYHGQGYHLEIQPRSVLNTLENGIPRFFCLYISSAAVSIIVVVNVNQCQYALTRGTDYDMMNVPQENGVRYALCVRPEYLVSFCRAVARSNRIIVMTAPPALTPHPWPVLVARIDQGSAWFTFPFNSFPSSE